MANLLPPEIKSKLLWQRRVRRSVVLLIAVLVGIILAALAILPVAVYTQIIRVGISSQAEFIETSNAGKQRQELIRKLDKNKEIIDQMSLIAKMPEFEVVFNEALSTLSTINRAELRSISVASNLEDSAYTIRLSGIAQDRASIFDIKDAFNQSEGLFVSDFPTGNLTSKGDEYNFVIELSTLSIDQDE